MRHGYLFGRLAPVWLLPIFCSAILLTGCGDNNTTIIEPPPDTTTSPRVGKRIIYARGTATPTAVEWIESDTSRRQNLLAAGLEIISEPRAGRFVARRAALATSGAPDSLFVVTISDRSMKFVAAIPSDTTSHAAMTPDAQRVVIYSGESQEIFIANATGGGLTSIAEFAMPGSMPSISPDGMLVAYVYSDWRGQSIHLVNVGGIDDRILADSAHAGMGGRVTWSPDGTQLAYTGIDDLGRPNLYIVNKDGTGRRRITGDGFSDFNPEWSPKGTAIAFTTMVGNRKDIWMMNMSDMIRRPLTTSDNRDEDFAQWSPDGNRILYVEGSGTSPRTIETIEVATGVRTVIATPAFGRAFWDYTK